MTTAYTVNSSFLFITIILNEIVSLYQPTVSSNTSRGLVSIDQITDEDGSLRNLWDPSYTSTDPDLDNYQWAVFLFTFDSPVDMTPIFKKYKSSIVPIQKDTEKTTTLNTTTYDTGTAVNVSKNTTLSGNVSVISKNQYSRNAPDGVASEDPYSGIGAPKQKGGKWQTNFIDPYTGQTKRAEAPTAREAVNTAKRAINNSRNQRLANIR